MKEKLERDIIRYVITICILFVAFNTFISLFPVFFPANSAISTTLAILFLLLLFQNQRRMDIEWIAFSLHLITLGAFTFFWIEFGGLSGSVSALLCAYIAFVGMATSGWARYATMLLIGIQMVVFFQYPEMLGMAAFDEPDRTNAQQVFVDYLLAGSMFMAFVYYFKQKFSFYRSRVASSHRELNHSANYLYEQNRELAAVEEETRAINDNLEALVDERTRQMEQKNAELAEYAFINAHLLRAPLCRILGLLNLMDQEPHLYPPEQVARVRAIAATVDRRIRDINALVG